MRSFMKLSVWLIFSILWIGMASCADKKVDDVKPEVFKRLNEKQIVHSEILQKDMTYAVILPPEYETSNDSYPVVYLLHGYGDNETAWYQGGNIEQYIDLYRNVSAAAIYVMPQGFNNYWVNRYNGQYNLMDFMVEELVPEIDRRFRTIKDAGSRAVMGYSMGAYGALVLAARNPGTFRTAVVLSMSFRTDEQYMAEPSDVFNSQWGSVFGGIGTMGEARLTEHFKDHSPFHFFTKAADPSMSGQNYFIDCGDDEETLSVTCNELHELMRDQQVKHEYRMRNGAHDWDYWHKSLPEAFSYLGYAFRNLPYPDEDTTLSWLPQASSISFKQISNLTGNIKMVHAANNSFFFAVILPEDYNTETKNYPVIYMIHDTLGRNLQSPGEMSEATLGLSLLMNANIKKNRLPESIVIDIPYGLFPLDETVMSDIIELVEDNLRTYPNGKYAVIIGNDKSGTITAQLAHDMPDQFNACLLFDASIPEVPQFNGDVAWYLDITDEGSHYKEYNALYRELRERGIPHEFRVRQGLPEYNSFLKGLDNACIFITSKLKN